MRHDIIVWLLQRKLYQNYGMSTPLQCRYKEIFLKVAESVYNHMVTTRKDSQTCGITITSYDYYKKSFLKVADSLKNIFLLQRKLFQKLRNVYTIVLLLSGKLF